VFKTFNACYDAVDAAYSKAMKDLGADENGTLLSDKPSLSPDSVTKELSDLINTKSINLTATCVRVY
jgi:hypothetical protein